jgi:hypothetical protein
VQVTNPPIDPLREGLVMSLNMRLGGRGALLTPSKDGYEQIMLRSPVLLETDLEAIKQQDLVKTEVRCPLLCPLLVLAVKKLHVQCLPWPHRQQRHFSLNRRTSTQACSFAVDDLSVAQPGQGNGGPHAEVPKNQVFFVCNGPA